MRPRCPILGLTILWLAAGLMCVLPGVSRATSWQRVAFPGCGARTVVFHPTDAETCYAGSQACGGALEGIHRSSSGGLSWIDLGTEEHSAKSIAIDPKDPRRLWVACPEGIYRSADGGASWTLSMDGLSFVPTAEFMTVIAVNPAYPETLYTAKRSSYGLDAVYRSTDHAETWTELYVPVPGYFNPPNDIEVSPKNPATVYVAMGSYLMVSHSHGEVGSWYSLLEDKKVAFRDVALDPDNPGRIFVASSGDAPYGGLYRSIDGGAHWKLLGPAEGLTSSRVITATVDSGSPTTMYVGTSNDSVRIYRSTNGGDSWEPFDPGLPEPCKINAIAVGPGKGSPLLAATSTDGIYRWDFTTRVVEEQNLLPALWLEQNRPNPFSLSTEIHFSLARRAEVRLDIFNVRGQRVRTLVAHTLLAGRHATTWDGRDGAGREAAGGVYFYRLQADGCSVTRRMMLLR
jgi:photosystem II stability/assembly factor-like uncharacterized protein